MVREAGHVSRVRKWWEMHACAELPFSFVFRTGPASLGTSGVAFHATRNPGRPVMNSSHLGGRPQEIRQEVSRRRTVECVLPPNQRVGEELHFMKYKGPAKLMGYRVW